MATDESALQYEDFNDPAFDAFVERTISEFPTPGLAVLVVHKSRIYAKGYGYSDVQKRTPVTPSTLFFTGSTTKSFTASMAAHLVESEHHPEITWETPLAEIIREDFVLDQSTASGQWATNRITIEDCLSHRTGLPRHDLAWVLEERNNREIVRALRYVRSSIFLLACPLSRIPSEYVPLSSFQCIETCGQSSNTRIIRTPPYLAP